MPQYPGSYRLLAAAYTVLGEHDKARDALAELLRLSPDTTVSGTRASLPIQATAVLDRYMDALRRAGLPEGP